MTSRRRRSGIVLAATAVVVVVGTSMFLIPARDPEHLPLPGASPAEVPSNPTEPRATRDVPRPGLEPAERGLWPQPSGSHDAVSPPIEAGSPSPGEWSHAKALAKMSGFPTWVSGLRASLREGGAAGLAAAFEGWEQELGDRKYPLKTPLFIGASTARFADGDLDGALKALVEALAVSEVGEWASDRGRPWLYGFATHKTVLPQTDEEIQARVSSVGWQARPFFHTYRVVISVLASKSEAEYFQWLEGVFLDEQRSPVERMTSAIWAHAVAASWTGFNEFPGGITPAGRALMQRLDVPVPRDGDLAARRRQFAEAYEAAVAQADSAAMSLRREYELAGEHHWELKEGGMIWSLRQTAIVPFLACDKPEEVKLRRLAEDLAKWR